MRYDDGHDEGWARLEAEERTALAGLDDEPFDDEIEEGDWP